jgi:hypothetical protein
MLLVLCLVVKGLTICWLHTELYSVMNSSPTQPQLIPLAMKAALAAHQCMFDTPSLLHHWKHSSAILQSQSNQHTAQAFISSIHYTPHLLGHPPKQLSYENP